MKKVKKVLQNGCKYSQDSTTLLFSIDFISLNLNFITISSKWPVLPLRPISSYFVMFRHSANLSDNIDSICLNNGNKYPQNSSTSFSIYFSINFVAISFPKIVKNYYGAPPPPELSSSGGLFTKSFIKTFVLVLGLCFTGKSFVHIFIALSVKIKLNVLNVLNVLKFPKIVKNYYGAPPPPEPTICQISFFDLF